MKSKRKILSTILIKIPLFLLFLIILITLAMDVQLRIRWAASGFNKGDDGYGLYVNDKIAGLKHNRNYNKNAKEATVRTGVYGNRNLRSIKGEIPFFVLGDSQLDCFVSDKDLATSIVNRDSDDIYLYNMGVTGASPAQYYQIARTAGIRKGSNIIIVFFLGNDSLQLLDESGYLPAIALTEEGSDYEIIKPVKEIMPRLAISSPLANLLYTWNLDRRTKDKIFDKDSQGEGSYRFFCDNPKQFNEAGRRFSFLLDHFRKDFKVSIVFLGNFLMSSDGAFEKKEHFQEQFTRLSKIAEDNGITSTLHIPKPGELDATFHPNVQGNISFSKHLKKHVRSLLDNQSKQAEECLD